MKRFPKLLSFLLVMVMLLSLVATLPNASAATTTKVYVPNNTSAAMVSVGQPNWNDGGYDDLPIKSHHATDVDTYALIKMDLSPYAGTVISKALLNVSGIGAGGAYSSHYVGVYRITSAWVDTVTYNTLPTYDTSPIATFYGATGTVIRSVDVTSTIQAYTTGGNTFYGFLLKFVEDCGVSTYYQVRWSTTYLSITYDQAPVTPTWAASFTSTPGTTATVGTSYSYTPTTNETATITAPTLPAWATYSGGTISGTPSAAGTYAFQVNAVGPGTLGADQYWNVTVSAAPVTSTWKPTFTNTPPDTVAFGDGYTYSPACNESVAYDLESFPAWAGLVDGSVIGLPNEVGSYDFSLKATSTAGTLSSWQNWTVTVEENTPIPAFLTSPVTNASKRVWYSYQPLTDMDCTWTVNSSAGWIVISQYTGQVFGLPTSPGTFHIVITATSVEYGTTATQAFDLTVADYVMPPDNDIGDGGSDGGDDSGGDSTLDIPERYLLTGLVIVIAFFVVVVLASRHH